VCQVGPPGGGWDERQGLEGRYRRGHGTDYWRAGRPSAGEPGFAIANAAGPGHRWIGAISGTTPTLGPSPGLGLCNPRLRGPDVRRLPPSFPPAAGARDRLLRRPPGDFFPSAVMPGRHLPRRPRSTAWSSPRTGYHLSPLRFAILAPQTWHSSRSRLLGIAIEAMLAGWLWKRPRTLRCGRIGRYLADGSRDLLRVQPSHPCLAMPIITCRDRVHPVPAALFFRSRIRGGWRGSASVNGRGRASTGWYPLSVSRAEETSTTRWPRWRCQPPSPAPQRAARREIDGMRADTLTPAVAPRLAGFAPETIRFRRALQRRQCLAGRQCSPSLQVSPRPTGCLADVARPPVLMDLFRDYGYRLRAVSRARRSTAGWWSWTGRPGPHPNLALGTVSPSPAPAADRILTGRVYAWLDIATPRVPSSLPLLQCRGGFEAPRSTRARGAGPTGRDGVGAPATSAISMPCTTSIP